ncbi:hypothetical protein [Enterocloster lavalensis]|uniref:hypothetical protein n=1 Tax=Enterocloster lavalensis TaxID=460384 RepID=UPI001409246E|nr:hypothetical protein [Enterocloster lavalensis]
MKPEPPEARPVVPERLEPEVPLDAGELGRLEPPVPLFELLPPLPAELPGLDLLEKLLDELERFELLLPPPVLPPPAPPLPNAIPPQMCNFAAFIISSNPIFVTWNRACPKRPETCLRPRCFQYP